jgi:hypothetical protein
MTKPKSVHLSSYRPDPTTRVTYASLIKLRHSNTKYWYVCPYILGFTRIKFVSQGVVRFQSQLTEMTIMGATGKF